MAVTSGTVTLSDHLTLSGLETGQAAAIGQRRTLTGRSVLQVQPTPGGRTLMLEGTHHWTYDQVAAVQALAASGAPVSLVHHRGTFSVVIASIEVEPSIDYANPSGSDWLSGSVTLLEV